MKTKEEIYAKQMSDLLYEMRCDDIYACTNVPVEYVNDIIDDDEHIRNIKKLIYDEVLIAVNAEPKQHQNNDGEYSYIGGVTYDFAYVIDTYVEDHYKKNVLDVLDTINARFRKSKLKKVINHLLDNSYQYEEQISAMLENYLKTSPTLLQHWVNTIRMEA